MNNRIIVDISNFIFVSNKPQKVDAIFLPGGSHPEQPEYAAKLYNKGFAKYVIPAGGVSVKRDKWSGVPRTAIFGEDKSGHTRDNAFFSRKIVNDNSLEIKTAMIACKAFHARRCLMLYQLAFPDTEFIVCPVHCYNITKNNWYTVVLCNCPLMPN